MKLVQLNKTTLALALSLMLAACGGTTSPDGDKGNGSSGGSTVGGAGNPNGRTTTTTDGATQIDLIASSTTLPSAAVQSENGVLLTAIVRDGDNNAVANPDVSFSADGGRLETGDGAQNNGTAAATLYNDPDRANRTITVKATTGDISDSINVDITGTKITITGPDAVAAGEQADFTAALRDSAGDPISGTALDVSSELNPPVSAATVDTNSSGEAMFAVTEQNPGTDTISASGRGASATKQVKAGGPRLAFERPNDAPESITVGQSIDLSVRYSDDNGPVGGGNVAFSASRGALSEPNPVKANARGIAATQLSSNIAGESTVTASAGGVQASRTVNFSAAAPSTLVFNASSATIQPSGTTSLAATVRDRFSNLVDNERINFRLGPDSTGSLSSAQSVTDASGTASVTYTAGPSSASEPVQVLASVADDDTVQDRATLTVAGEALSIRLGTGGPPVLSSDGTTYAAPYAVLISDAAGNPVPDAKLRLNVESTQYRAADSSEINCASEDDKINNGILDAGEDRNQNGELDPGTVANVPSAPELDDSGVARFNVTYLSRFADRVQVLLTATAGTAGSEGGQKLSINLSGTPSSDNPFANCSAE